VKDSYAVHVNEYLLLLVEVEYVTLQRGVWWPQEASMLIFFETFRGEERDLGLMWPWRIALTMECKR